MPSLKPTDHETANKHTGRFAGFTFVLRVGNAGLAFVTQVLLARWMGASDFGVYAYIWTWVLLLGATTGLGLGSTAQRLIPEYTASGSADRLRGFIAGARWLALGSSGFIAIVGCILLVGFQQRFSAAYMLPACLGLLCVPFFVVTDIQEGIARTFNWSDLSMWPAYCIRPLLFVASAGVLYASGGTLTAEAVMWSALLATVLTAVLQTIRLQLKLKREIPAGPRTALPGQWLAVSLPILLTDSFFMLLSYCDILLLGNYVKAEEVSVYFAATKLVSLVAFVYFAVASASAHRFAQLHFANEHGVLDRFMRATTKWTFLPSLAFSILLVIFARPLLQIFGPGFVEGQSVLIILLGGLVVRASIGPAEKLLNMLGQQKLCTTIYALAFVINIAMNTVLVPRIGLNGAAWATSIAMVAETILLMIAARRRLGLNVFILR